MWASWKCLIRTMQDRTAKNKTECQHVGLLRNLSSFCLGETDADCTDQRIFAASQHRDRWAHPERQGALRLYRQAQCQKAHLPGGDQCGWKAIQDGIANAGDTALGV